MFCHFDLCKLFLSDISLYISNIRPDNHLLIHCGLSCSLTVPSIIPMFALYDSSLPVWSVYQNFICHIHCLWSRMMGSSFYFSYFLKLVLAVFTSFLEILFWELHIWILHLHHSYSPSSPPPVSLLPPKSWPFFPNYHCSVYIQKRTDTHTYTTKTLWVCSALLIISMCSELPTVIGQPLWELVRGGYWVSLSAASDHCSSPCRDARGDLVESPVSPCRWELPGIVTAMFREH